MHDENSDESAFKPFVCVRSEQKRITRRRIFFPEIIGGRRKGNTHERSRLRARRLWPYVRTPPPQNCYNFLLISSALFSSIFPEERTCLVHYMYHEISVFSRLRIRYPTRLERTRSRRATYVGSSQLQPTPPSHAPASPVCDAKTQNDLFCSSSTNHANLPASAHFRLYDRTPARVSVCGYRCFPPQKGCLQ